MDAERLFFSVARIRLFFLFGFIIVLAYSNTFHASWQLDDKPNILNNRRIQLSEISTEQLWQSMNARPGSGGFYRPVVCATLAINWFFGKRNVFGYHLFNILVHVGTTWFLFLTICTLFSTPRLKDHYPRDQIFFIAGLASILWALNPVQTQAVTYIVQRMASMAGMFAVLSIFFYLRARICIKNRSKWLFYLLSFVCYILGLFSKENVVILPLIVPILDALFFHEHSRPLITPKNVVRLIVLALFCLLVIFLLKPNAVNNVLKYYNHRPFTLAERVLTEPRVVLFYLSQIFFPLPSRFSVEHDITLSISLLSPWTTLPFILVHIFLLVIAFKVNNRQPLIALAILFFYLNHIIESTIVPLELIFEHRNYLPSVFLFLPIAQLLNFLVMKAKGRRSMLIGMVLLISCGVTAEAYATFTRNSAWKTEETLWLDALKKAPRSARPVATLAILLAWGENPSPFKYKKALALTKRSLDLRMSRYYEADQLGNIANLYDKLGQKEKAIEFYERSLQINPKHTKNRYDLVNALIRYGKFKRAATELQHILDQGRIHADYYSLLGYCHLWLGEPATGLPLLQKALELAPLRPDILLYIGNAMSSLGHYDRAQWFLNLAIKEGGGDVIVGLNLIQNALLKGDLLFAEAILRKMLHLFPLPRILDNLELTDARYKSVPLDRPGLSDFIYTEIRHLSSRNN